MYFYAYLPKIRATDYLKYNLKSRGLQMYKIWLYLSSDSSATRLLSTFV